MQFDWAPWGKFLLALGISILLTFLVALLIRLIADWAKKKHPSVVEESAAPRRYLTLLTSVILLQISVIVSWPSNSASLTVRHVLTVIIVGASALLVTSLVNVFVDAVRARHPIVDEKDEAIRRINTQLSLVRGLLVATIWLVATGIALFTIPGAQAIGTSLLASAGLASVVAGVAAQSVLGNVFAGLQIAFSGSVRVGDVVVVENGESGHVDDIKLTSVIVRTWDERYLVLPSTFFTTTPFENWTLSDSKLAGTVLLDVDWRIEPEAMRQKLLELLKADPLWDGRTSGLTIEDATGGLIRVRATMSATDPQNLFTLRSNMREALVGWVATRQQESLPVYRTIIDKPDQFT